VRLVLAVLAVSAVPLIVFSASVYVNTRRVVGTEVDTSHEKYMRQTGNAIEIIFRQILDTCLSLADNPSVSEFEFYYRASSYEEMKAPYPEDELRRHAEYYFVKERFFHALSQIRICNQFVDSVYYYDAEKGLVFTDQHRQMPSPSFPDMGWQGASDRPSHGDLAIVRRIAVNATGVSVPVISVLFRSRNRPENVFVINLDVAEIGDRIAAVRPASPASTFHVMDGEGESLIRIGDEATVRTSSELVLGALRGGSAEAFAQFRLEGIEYLSYGYPSSLFGWVFASAVNVEDLHRVIAASGRWLFAMAVLVLGSIAVLACFAAGRIYKPVGDLVRLVRKDQAEPSRPASRGRHDELYYLQEQFTQYFSKREELEKRLSQSMPALREKALLRLLRTDRMTLPEISECLSVAGIDLRPTGLYVALICTGVRTRPAEGGNTLLHGFAVSDLVDQALPSGYPHAAAEVESGRYALAINGDAECSEELAGIAERLRDRIEEVLGTDCAVGLSRWCPDATELRRAYGEAARSVDTQVFFGGVGLPPDDNGLQEGKLHSTHLQDRIESLVGDLRRGEKEAAFRTVSDIIATLRATEAGMSQHRVQQVLAQTLTHLIEFSEQMGIDPSRLSAGDGANLYTELLETASLDEIEAWLRGLIDRILDSIREEFDLQTGRLVRRMQVYLDEHFRPDMGLKMLSGVFHLTPGYIGKLFKKHLDTNFIDYVTALRIQKSKDLLLRTDLTIREIGRSVGYNSSRYFINVFKRHTSVTPGAYRASVSRG
jgi:two-component system, response regulator YesN